MSDITFAKAFERNARSSEPAEGKAAMAITAKPPPFVQSFIPHFGLVEELNKPMVSLSRRRMNNTPTDKG